MGSPVMPSARDKLIADWRGRLALAESSDAAAGSRPAWLARMQRRLYRMLLSMYGEAPWRTEPRQRRRRPDPSTAPPALFEAPEALPLTGKPAKSIGKIRETLKAVGNAQGTPPPAGPLAGGLDSVKWVAIAVDARDAATCAQALQGANITARFSDGQVDVPAYCERDARWLVAQLQEARERQRLHQLRLRRAARRHAQASQRFRSPYFMAGVCGILTGLAFYPLILASLSPPRTYQDWLISVIIAAFAVWCISVTPVLVVAWRLRRSRLRIGSSNRAPSSDRT